MQPGASRFAEKPKRIGMRPLIAIVVCVLCAAASISRPERGWKIAGFALLAAMVLVILGSRVLLRRIQKAREPDPDSTLHLND